MPDIANRPPNPKKKTGPVVKKERKKEPAGTHVDCGGRLYTLETLLGSGGFGDVYKVSYQGQFFAMKTERFDEVPEARRRLKVEYNVYTAVQSAAQKHANRYIFPKMQEFGKTKTFAFMIMEIVGPSLFDIRKKMLNGENPSPRAVAEIARQTLWSIEVLHDLGWTHRDIKPHNYAIGLPPRDSSIVMLDFGTARMYREKDGRMRAPRSNPVWKGTPRYATARGLKRKEQSRRDDMEIWCFMMLEFYELRNMHWSYGSFTLPMIIAMKEKMMNDAAAMREKKLIECPARFCEIMAYVCTLTYSGAVDFNKIHGILEEIIKDEKIDMTLPLDWIGKEIAVDKDKGKLPRKEKSTGPMEANLGIAGSARDSSSKGSSGLFDRKRKEDSGKKRSDRMRAALEEKMRRLEEEILKISSELGEDEDKGRKKGRKKQRRREEEDEESGSSEDSEEESYRRHRRRRRKPRSRKRGRGHRTREESDLERRRRREDSDRDRRRADRPRDSPDREREKDRDKEDDNVKDTQEGEKGGRQESPDRVKDTPRKRERRRTSEDKKRAGVKNKDASEEKEKRKEKDAKKGSIEDQKPEAVKDKNNEKATDEKGKDKGKKNSSKEMLSPEKASLATQETPSKDSDNKKK